jgi:ribonuclease E
METPHFEVQRLRDDDAASVETSYKIAGTSIEDSDAKEAEPLRAPAQPAVQQITHTAPAPTPVAKAKPGLFSRLIGAIAALFTGGEDNTKKHQKSKDSGKDYQNQRNRNQRGGRGGRNPRGGRRADRRDEPRDDKRDDKREPKREEKRAEPRDSKRPDKREDKRDDKREDKRDDRRELTGETASERPRGEGQRRRRRRGGSGDNSGRSEAQTNSAEMATADLHAAPETAEDEQRPSRRPSNVRGRPQPRRRGRRGDSAPGAPMAAQNKEELEQEVNEAIDEAEVETQQAALDLREVREPRSERQFVEQVSEAAAESETAAPVETTAEEVQAEIVVQQQPQPEIEVLTGEQLAETAMEIAEAAQSEAEPVQAVEAAVEVQIEEEAPRAEIQESQTVAGAPAVSTFGGRASNDPRVNPQPMQQLAVVTEHRDLGLLNPLDTAQPAAIEHKPRALTRPANDPRVARQAAQANDESDPAEAG